MKLSNALILAAVASAACSSNSSQGSSSSAASKGDATLSPQCKPLPLGPLNGGVSSGIEITPAPPSVGADVPAMYFGPAPSSVNPKLVGPVQLLKSGVVDIDHTT